jgi:uracil phosphoribosyltransferase
MFKVFVFFSLLTVSFFPKNLALDPLLYNLRDPQTTSYVFRDTLEKIGEYLALEVLSHLDNETVEIKTLTGGVAKHKIISENPVLVTILRAGLPLNQGVHKVFKDSDLGFLAMSRCESTLKPKVDYIALPDLKNKIVILTDTMIATGGSLIDALKIIESRQPKSIFVISAIASEQGVARLQAHNPSIVIISAAIDPVLNEKGFIVPGLGDAGDRAFGDKK